MVWMNYSREILSFEWTTNDKNQNIKSLSTNLILQKFELLKVRIFSVVLEKGMIFYPFFAY